MISQTTVSNQLLEHGSDLYFQSLQTYSDELRKSSNKNSKDGYRQKTINAYVSRNISCLLNNRGKNQTSVAEYSCMHKESFLSRRLSIKHLSSLLQKASESGDAAHECMEDDQSLFIPYDLLKNPSKLIMSYSCFICDPFVKDSQYNLKARSRAFECMKKSPFEFQKEDIGYCNVNRLIPIDGDVRTHYLNHHSPLAKDERGNKLCHGSSIPTRPNASSLDGHYYLLSCGYCDKKEMNR